MQSVGVETLIIFFFCKFHYISYIFHLGLFQLFRSDVRSLICLLTKLVNPSRLIPTPFVYKYKMF
jgi:hypothetical protein